VENSNVVGTTVTNQNCVDKGINQGMSATIWSGNVCQFAIQKQKSLKYTQV
jgi:hypothetical protein